MKQVWVYPFTYPSPEQGSVWLKKKDQLTRYLAPSTEIIIRSRREGETVFGAAWLHLLLEWAPGPPEGHQDRFACHLLFSTTCCKFIIVASELPQQQLGGLFKPKWYLQAVRRHIEITLHIHTEEEEKLHQKVIMEIRIQLSAVPNRKWYLWWSVLSKTKREKKKLINFSQRSLLPLRWPSSGITATTQEAETFYLYKNVGIESIFLG